MVKLIPGFVYRCHRRTYSHDNYPLFSFAHKAVSKTTKTKKVKKEVEKPTIEVVAKEAVTEEVTAEKEGVNDAPSITATKEKTRKSYALTSVYLSIAAGVVLAIALTIVVFFQDEYESVVAGMQTEAVVSEVATDTSVTTQIAEVKVVDVQWQYRLRPHILTMPLNLFKLIRIGINISIRSVKKIMRLILNQNVKMMQECLRYMKQE